MIDDIDLTSFDEAYKEAEAAPDYEPVPDGIYRVTIEKVELVRAKTSSATLLKYTLRINGPKYENRVLFRNNVISSDERQLGYLKKDLRVCGIELGRLSDLKFHMDNMIGLRLEVSKRTKTGDGREQENIYINKRLEDGASF